MKLFEPDAEDCTQKLFESDEVDCTQVLFKYESSSFATKDLQRIPVKEYSSYYLRYPFNGPRSGRILASEPNTSNTPKQDLKS